MVKLAIKTKNPLPLPKKKGKKILWNYNIKTNIMYLYTGNWKPDINDPQHLPKILALKLKKI